MAYTKYSLTPANNNAAPPDGAPEGMLPSAVNDTMRDMMAQIRDVGDGIRGGTYTMTAPVITGGSITGVALSGNTLTNPVITGGSINNTPIGATTASTGKFSTLTNAALTSGRVTYAGTSGVLQDDADFTFNGTTVTMANDASISGLTVGKGGGSQAQATAFGLNALAAVNTGTYNTAIGITAGQYNTSGGSSTFIGGGAGNANTTGSNNTAVGAFPLFLNTTGANNTALGTAALQSNTTASNNTAVGYQAGYSNTTSASNTFIGHTAGYSTTSTRNVFVGQGSGYWVSSGAKNVILGNFDGNQGGLDIRTASNHIVLSDGDGNPRFGSTSNNLVLFGTNAYIASQNSSLFAYGNLSSSSGVVLANNATSWASTSDERRKDIIEPITDAANKVSALRAVIGKFKTDEEGTRRPFLIAQDVQAVLPEAVQNQTDKNGEFLCMSYTDVVPLLVAAIKELKAEIDQLKGAK